MNTQAFPTVPCSSLPQLTADQMREVDRVVVEELHVELLQMMENAGRHLAQLARVLFLNGNAAGKRLVILAGTGGNGGGALVCARHLHNAGALVHVVTARPAEAFAGVPAQQLDILARMHVPLSHAQPPSGPADLIVDGLIGYSLDGTPRGTVAELIRWANRQPVPRLSLDVPSGLDATAGTAFDPTVKATATLTLALPKQGLSDPSATPYVGELYLADISVPPQLYKQVLGLEVGPLFAKGQILSLQR